MFTNYFALRGVKTRLGPLTSSVLLLLTPALSICLGPEEACDNSYQYACDGACDDGGPNADFSLCDCGTDCADCGKREKVGNDCLNASGSGGSSGGAGGSGSSGGSGSGGSGSGGSSNQDYYDLLICHFGYTPAYSPNTTWTVRIYEGRKWAGEWNEPNMGSFQLDPRNKFILKKKPKTPKS